MTAPLGGAALVVLASADEHGRVFGSSVTVRQLIARGLVEPRGLGVRLTEAGRLAARSQEEVDHDRS